MRQITWSNPKKNTTQGRLNKRLAYEITLTAKKLYMLEYINLSASLREIRGNFESVEKAIEIALQHHKRLNKKPTFNVAVPPSIHKNKTANKQQTKEAVARRKINDLMDFNRMLKDLNLTEEELLL